MKRSVILTDRLDLDILLVLRVKGRALYRERAHFKATGCSLALSALLTKKLHKFLSRLNEKSGVAVKSIILNNRLNYSKMIQRLVESFRNLH